MLKPHSMSKTTSSFERFNKVLAFMAVAKD